MSIKNTATDPKTMATIAPALSPSSSLLESSFFASICSEKREFALLDTERTNKMGNILE